MSPTESKSRRADIGSFRFIDNEEAFETLLDELCGVDRYGIDTEFVRERTYFAHLALVQISFEGGIALVDPQRVEIAALARLLSSSALAIFHACDQDLEVLERSCGVLPKQIFSTRVAAGFIGMSTPSLQSLVERLLQLRLEKGDQLTDWSKRPLDDRQLRYAAGDVAFLLEAHDVLKSDLTRLGRLEWAESECAEVLERPRLATTAEEAWWKLKQARQLRGRSRQIAQCVAAWRENRARDLDVPTRFILSDLAVASIAHRPPDNVAELEQVRNVDARHLAGGAGEGLMEAINLVKKLDPDNRQLPPIQLGDNAPKAAVLLAAAWVNERARELRLDPTLLATRADLAAYLRQPPGGRLTTSWRGQLVGEPMTALINGEASLALVNGTSLVLEQRSGRPLAVAETNEPSDDGSALDQ